MKALPAFPELTIVPIYSLQPHEYIDERRVEELVLSLKADQILQNPPVVMPLTKSADHYVILDGASRMAAFDRLGFPHILVQVIQQTDPFLQVQTWNHVILGPKPEALLTSIRSSGEIRLEEISSKELDQLITTQFSTPLLLLANGMNYQIGWPGNSLTTKLHYLNALAVIYSQDGRVERTSTWGVEPLVPIYHDFSCLILLPKFNIREVLEATEAGILFPAGLTRFIITPRALRVNYPIPWLEADQSVMEKREQLAGWFRDRIRLRNLRFYEEATFLFDD
jgi:hypothetical protein